MSTKPKPKKKETVVMTVRVDYATLKRIDKAAFENSRSRSRQAAHELEGGT